MHAGKSFYNVGLNCDVLSGFPKHIGILNAVRTLSPEWVIADEIGTVQEANSVLTGLNSGVHFLLSLHADSVDKALLKPQMRVLKNSGGIEAAVLLGEGEHIGQVVEFRRL